MIRSYYKDFRWLVYALASIRRYCSGFRKIVVVVPESSREKLQWMGLAGVETISCPDYHDDYLGQQITKLTADAFTNADYVCHVDSDCIFRAPTKPGDLIGIGKPRILMEAYDRLDPHVPWKGIVERFLRRAVEYEYMRTPPYTYPRWIYAALRERAAVLHGSSLEEYILKQPSRGFSEFNALGAYAFYEHHDRFEWLELAGRQLTESPCRVFWSWAGIDPATKREIEELLS